MSRKMTRQVRPIVGLMLASAMFCAGGVAVVAAPAPQAHAVSMSEYQAKVSNHAKLKSQLAGVSSDLADTILQLADLNDNQIPFEVNALSAHRTPDAVESFAKGAKERGVKVIIAAAGMAAALPGVIAANTTLPVIGVPVKGSVLDGVDALYSIIQMPPGIPVATVAINGAMNAAILAVQMLALGDSSLAETFATYKEGLKKKIVKANEDLKDVKYEYKTN